MTLLQKMRCIRKAPVRRLLHISRAGHDPRTKRTPPVGCAQMLVTARMTFPLRRVARSASAPASQGPAPPPQAARDPTFAMPHLPHPVLEAKRKSEFSWCAGVTMTHFKLLTPSTFSPHQPLRARRPLVHHARKGGRASELIITYSRSAWDSGLETMRRSRRTRCVRSGVGGVGVDDGGEV